MKPEEPLVPQPAGANIRELKWNDELAKVAQVRLFIIAENKQAWAEQCPSAPDQFNDRKIFSESYAVGQNIYHYWGFNGSTLWKNAIDSWYNEVADMPNTEVSSFTGNPPSMRVIGHYTQVVWANTYEIGCGGVLYSTDLGGTTYPESKIYVCNYGSAGNYIGQEIYTQGTAASQCSNGISTTYPDLCA
ncbi:scoloptoxin SSD976-like [Palaemon carinicauda]|uniref:scoloptoxin SSD976-like n=1 Tax=Palaemon carinicauda TaxID=392227 RepID=UPI0035B6646A